MSSVVIINICVIYLILLTVILTLWRLIDKNFQHMEQLESGRTAERAMNNIISVMHATNYFLWYEDGDSFNFGDRFFEILRLRKRPLSKELVKRLVAPSQLQMARKAYSDLGEEARILQLDLWFPVSKQWHTLLIKASKVHMENGEEVRMGIFTIADERKKMEEERKKAFALEEESKMKASFLASMGHEIRTPLNVITGFSKLLAEDYGNLSEEERRSYYEIIKENNTQLLKLLNDVLTSSLKKGNEVQLQLRRKRVSDLIEELYTTHNVVVPKHLRFYMQQGSCEDFIDVNRSGMMQVVSNLMNNAIKFTKEGSITLGWESVGDKVIIYVQDTGIGIAEENLTSVFDKFFKQDASSVGAGIGLPLCKKLVENMHGEIRVKSKLGVGSRFEIVFDKVGV